MRAAPLLRICHSHWDTSSYSDIIAPSVPTLAAHEEQCHAFLRAFGEENSLIVLAFGAWRLFCSWERGISTHILQNDCPFFMSVSYFVPAQQAADVKIYSHR